MLCGHEDLSSAHPAAIQTTPGAVGKPVMPVLRTQSRDFTAARRTDSIRDPVLKNKAERLRRGSVGVPTLYA